MSIQQRMDWFESLCAEACIDPAIARENENLREAIKRKDWQEVRRIVREDF